MIKFYVVAHLLVAQMTEKLLQPPRNERGATSLEWALIGAAALAMATGVVLALKAVVDRETGKIN